jgi:DNA-binding MarR family transcriptional regulator
MRDLRVHQKRALRVLSASGSLPASVLARAVGHTPKEAAEFCRRLGARGLVDLAGGNNRRPALVSLTPRGQRVLARLGAFLVLAACCGGAEAQQRVPCTRVAGLMAGLAENYHEKPVAMKLQPDGLLLEIFASPDTGTWTAVTVTPTGLACVVATGKGWQQGAAGEPA